VRSRYVIAKGVRLWCLESGPADGPLVLLMHGFPEIAYSWRNQMGPFGAAGFHVIAPDLPGYGRSDKPDVTYDCDWINGTRGTGRRSSTVNRATNPAGPGSCVSQTCANRALGAPPCIARGSHGPRVSCVGTKRSPSRSNSAPNVSIGSSLTAGDRNGQPASHRQVWRAFTTQVRFSGEPAGRSVRRRIRRLAFPSKQINPSRRGGGRGATRLV
jgi:hypothetical protein